MYKNNSGGGGGGEGVEFFFRKIILSHFTFYAIFNISRKNGRWFFQIVDIGNLIMRLEILKSAPSLTG